MYTVKVYFGNKIKNISVEEKSNLLSILANNGIELTAPCGGNGICGKCKVKIKPATEVLNDEKKLLTEEEINEGIRLACFVDVVNDLEVFVDSKEFSVLTNSAVNNRTEVKNNFSKGHYGLAVDIGTTTLVSCLINLKSGKKLDYNSSVNTQNIYGSDVISRINSIMSDINTLNNMQDCVLDFIDESLLKFEKQYPCVRENLKEIEIAGNTTMLHIFAGVNPSSLALYPFTPVFIDLKIMNKDVNRKLKIEDDCLIKLLPSISAYVGADITAGITVIKNNFINSKEKNVLFVDIGTNGEMALITPKGITCCSTAAGPAFEGARITCGTGSIEGAISKVNFNLDSGEIFINTIANKEASGICGTGLIDIISCMIKEKIIDETGAIDDLYDGKFADRLVDDRFYITDKIYINQKDIRELQLAKSAIRSGMETLLISQGLKFSSINNLYIAGGFGTYINIANSCIIGLLPKEMSDKTKAVGNTSLEGAYSALINKDVEKQIINIAVNSKNIELAESAVFNQKFIENMYFE